MQQKSSLRAALFAARPATTRLHGWAGRCRRNCGHGRRSGGDRRSDPQGHTREAEVAARVVDHVDLADVGPGLESGERHIELEANRVPLRNVDRVGFDYRSFVDLYAAEQELDAGEHADGAALPACESGA